MCTDRIGEKPAGVEECNLSDVCPEWYTGPWLPVCFFFIYNFLM